MKKKLVNGHTRRRQSGFKKFVRKESRGQARGGIQGEDRKEETATAPEQASRERRTKKGSTGDIKKK